MHPSIPELRHAGWAVVQISEDGVPLRAVFVGVPGVHRTVGIAEWLAVARALEFLPQLCTVVSARLFLVQEGQRWSAADAGPLASTLPCGA